MNTQNTEVDFISLRQKISTHFNLDEIRILCFDISIDFENISGYVKEVKIAELISYCFRRGKLLNLLQTCHKYRPHINWFTPIVANPQTNNRADAEFPRKYIIEYGNTFEDNDNIERSRVDIKLLSIAGSFRIDQLTQELGQDPENEATAMAVAVLLARTHVLDRDRDEDIARLLVTLVKFRRSRVRFRAARSITSQSNIASTSLGALQIMKEGVISQLKKETGKDHRLYPKGALKEAEFVLKSRK